MNNFLKLPSTVPSASTNLLSYFALAIIKWSLYSFRSSMLDNYYGILLKICQSHPFQFIFSASDLSFFLSIPDVFPVCKMSRNDPFDQLLSSYFKLIDSNFNFFIPFCQVIIKHTSTGSCYSNFVYRCDIFNAIQLLVTKITFSS